MKEDYYISSLESLLESRKNLIVNMLEMLPERAIDLEEARASAELAWSNRNDPSTFIQHDSMVITHICIKANLHSVAWMWNSICEIYHKVGTLMPMIFNVPDSYMKVYSEVFDHISKKEINTAQNLVNDYITEMDDKIITTAKILIQSR